MKKVILLAVLALMAMTMQAKVDVEVSETVELMSILARTAGSQEFCMDMAGDYTKDTEAWFASFKEHPAVRAYQELQQDYGIGYNAPMDLAVNLVIDGSRLKFVGDKKCMDDRWMNVDIDAFVSKLNDFYTDTRFHEFFQQHQSFYNDVLQQYEAKVMQYFNQDWYPRFYGTEPGEIFRLIIGFTNGGGNYGVNRQLPGKPKESFSVCGYWSYPGRGSLVDPKNAKTGAAPILIHEFNHSFVNPLQETEKNAKLLGDIPQRLLEQDYYTMSRQAYPEGKTVFNESVVRAAVVLYMMENGYSAQEVQNEIMEQVSRGFKWTPELVAALRDYSAHRNKYPTLNDFYPQIAKVLNKYLDTEQKRLDKALKFKQTANQPSATSALQAEVMETVELMSVLSRVAGYQEYGRDWGEQYVQDIDNWFASYNQHPIIEFYQGLRQQYGIAYDAPMSLAVRLSADGGKIVKLQEEGDSGLDGRWNGVDMKKFLGLLNQFYTDTRFHEFFQQHQSYYQKELKSINDNVMSYIHPEWFSKFYGEPSANTNKVVVGFANGGNGYGAYRHLKGQNQDDFVIVGHYSFVQEGQSQEETRDVIAMMVIGMLNNLPAQSSSEEEKTVALFKEVGKKMLVNNQNLVRQYGDSQSLINNSIGEAAEIIYAMENGASAKQVGRQLANDISAGFTWMPELVTAMRDYVSHRNKYSKISDFYPQIAKVLNKCLDTEQKRLDKALK